MEFEWDDKKEAANVKKHGISFLVAVECFEDPKSLVFDDTAHSESEQRFFLIGKTKAGRVLTVWYTERANKYRIIGCAEFRKLRRLYNERTKGE